jgi:hypothetical protein
VLVTAVGARLVQALSGEPSVGIGAFAGAASVALVMSRAGGGGWAGGGAGASAALRGRAAERPASKRRVWSVFICS